MKNGLYLFLFLGLVLSSCSKDDNQAEMDQQVILDYITENNIDAIAHPSGLHYAVTTEGTGSSSPSIFSEVQVEYKGYLADGTIFDESEAPVIFDLGMLIEGWQIGIPLLKKGGEGLFLIPSELGYGSNARAGIPSNSVLIFEIKLIDFN
jgi:FKBP-type peptidyl-prolyl cis-trans isomerase FkpA